MIKLKEAGKPMKFPWDDLVENNIEEMRDIFKFYFPDGHEYVAYIEGDRYLLTREEAIEMGFVRDPSKPFTMRERIRNRISDWHEKRAALHDYKARRLRCK